MTATKTATGADEAGFGNVDTMPTIPTDIASLVFHPTHPDFHIGAEDFPEALPLPLSVPCLLPKLRSRCPQRRTRTPSRIWGSPQAHVRLRDLRLADIFLRQMRGITANHALELLRIEDEEDAYLMMDHSALAPNTTDADPIPAVAPPVQPSTVEYFSPAVSLPSVPSKKRKCKDTDKTADDPMASASPSSAPAPTPTPPPSADPPRRTCSLNRNRLSFAVPPSPPLPPTVEPQKKKPKKEAKKKAASTSSSVASSTAAKKAAADLETAPSAPAPTPASESPSSDVSPSALSSASALASAPLSSASRAAGLPMLVLAFGALLGAAYVL
ncbi:hypothetical protein B0H10DRAFT_2234867 [Mycena sp. CBHHK59/15]|nr:hypothetical protein B0H10DRAFT_2234867 [Mycena sp. CBHHK59/15]